MIVVRLVVSGCLGALIGYMTNFIAIRMLFYPERKTLGFQGLLARFKDSFAEKTADFIFQFLDFDEILESLSKKRILTRYARNTDWSLSTRWAALLVLGGIEHGLKIEMVRKDIAARLGELTPIAKSLLARKIAESDYEILRNLIIENTSREVHFIQLLGGILGMVIGFIQPFVFQ